jgi:glycosyltransferase involved in cell wall biosynthesis
MKLLLVSTSFGRDYGGPAVSVSHLGAALTTIGARVGLWAPDGSATVSSVIPQSNGNLFRLEGKLEDALGEFGQPDIVHDNGLWLPHNHKISILATKLRVPRVVSVRGMLEPWAIRHKRIKKAAAWQLYQRRDLERAAFLHSTAESESQAIRAQGLKTPIVTIANGTVLPNESLMKRRPRVPGETRKALFLSRIHPKKGLPMLIQAWATLRPLGWQLDIAGPDEGGHRAEIERLVREHNLTDVVSFKGPLEGEAKERAYREADFFVLPTYSENFGIVIAEALSFGIPVLTTRGAPWAELESACCGWWIEPTVNGVLRGLIDATAATPETLTEMGRRGRKLVAENYGWEHIAQSFLDAYDKILQDKGGSRIGLHV